MWFILWLEALNAKRKSQVLLRIHKHEPSIDNSKKKKKATESSWWTWWFTPLSRGIDVFVIWSLTSLFFLNDSVSFPRIPPDAGWIESCCTLRLVIRKMTSQGSGFSLSRCSQSVFLQYVCSNVLFCPCLSQQSGLIYLNNKVQCVHIQYHHHLCVSVVIVYLVAWWQKAITQLCCNRKLFCANACQCTLMHSCMCTVATYSSVIYIHNRSVLKHAHVYMASWTLQCLHYVRHMSCMRKWMDRYREFHRRSTCGPRCVCFTFRMVIWPSLPHQAVSEILFKPFKAILGKAVFFFFSCAGHAAPGR